jgi:hypothetical protein
MTTTSVTTPARPVKREEPEWVVVAVVVVALLIGWMLKNQVESRSVTFSGPALSLNYPATWFRELNPDDGDVIFSVTDMGFGSCYRSRVTVRATEALPQLAGMDDDAASATAAVTAWTFQRSQDLDGFRLLSTKSTELDGHRGVRINYAYVSDPIASPYRKALPVVVEAVDYLFSVGDQTIVITTAAAGTQFEQESQRFATILSSVDFGGK